MTNTVKMETSGSNYALVKIGSYHWVIFSYNTPVLEIVYRNGESCYKRTWDGYSVTTMRHIRYCLQFLGMSPICKKDWDSMEISNI